MDLKWCPHLGSNKKFNFEFVQVLSGYGDSISVHVAYMNKLKGFTCLFHRGKRLISSPAKDMFRFSHRIPSIKMTGMEKDGIPEGSCELDHASLTAERINISSPSIDQREAIYCIQ